MTFVPNEDPFEGVGISPDIEVVPRVNQYGNPPCRRLVPKPHPEWSTKANYFPVVQQGGSQLLIKLDCTTVPLHYREHHTKQTSF